MMDSSPILTDEQIPEYLPNQYYRMCADEDGCMTKYRVPTEKRSYCEGYNAGHDASDTYWQDKIRELEDALRDSPDHSDLDAAAFQINALKSKLKQAQDRIAEAVSETQVGWQYYLWDSSRADKIQSDYMKGKITKEEKHKRQDKIRAEEKAIFERGVEGLRQTILQALIPENKEGKE